MLEDGVEPFTQPVAGEQFQSAGEVVLGGGLVGALLEFVVGEDGVPGSGGTGHARAA